MDLDYPRKIHNDHNDYPLAPEHVLSEFENLSPLQKALNEKYGLPKNSGIKKLIPNLYNKQKYVVYGTTLKLELGLRL